MSSIKLCCFLSDYIQSYNLSTNINQSQKYEISRKPLRAGSCAYGVWCERADTTRPKVDFRNRVEKNFFLPSHFEVLFFILFRYIICVILDLWTIYNLRQLFPIKRCDAVIFNRRNIKGKGMAYQSDQCRSWSNASLLSLLCGAVNFAKFGPYHFTYVFVNISCAMEIYW